MAVLLVLGTAISLLSAGHSSSRGCIDFALAYSTGGQDVYRCGEAARSTCTTARTRGGYTASTQQSLEAACRKAGLAVG